MAQKFRRESIREIAIANVDAECGHTMEFCCNPYAHRQAWAEETDRLFGQIQWVRWTSYGGRERGQVMGKWHTRIGTSRRTLCGQEINVLASISMEREGQCRKRIKPKSNICKFCEPLVETE